MDRGLRSQQHCESIRLDGTRAWSRTFCSSSRRKRLLEAHCQAVTMNRLHTKQPHRLELSLARLFALQVVALDYELPGAAPESNHGYTHLTGRSRRMRLVEEAFFRHPNLRQRGEQGQFRKNRLFAWPLVNCFFNLWVPSVWRSLRCNPPTIV